MNRFTSPTEKLTAVESPVGKPPLSDVERERLATEYREVHGGGRCGWCKQIGMAFCLDCGGCERCCKGCHECRTAERLAKESDLQVQSPQRSPVYALARKDEQGRPVLWNHAFAGSDSFVAWKDKGAAEDFLKRWAAGERYVVVEVT